jgi:hypothetical protein
MPILRLPPVKPLNSVTIVAVLRGGESPDKVNIAILILQVNPSQRQAQSAGFPDIRLWPP